jgi:hypothetical protein
MKVKKAGKTENPPWHPNFRITDDLPDIKTVRVRFFVNFGTLVAAAVAAYLFAMPEYTAMTFAEQNAGYSRQLETQRGANSANLRLSRDYEKLGANIEELATFRSLAIEPDDALVALAETRSREITLSKVQLGGETRYDDRDMSVVPVLTVSGFVTGQSEEATRAFTAFRDDLAELELLRERIVSIQEYPERNDELGVLTFRLAIELKGAESA